MSVQVGLDRGADRASNDADVSSILLSFRTAGFPQYGWKAGLSDGACLYVVQLKPAPGIRCSSSSLHPSLVHFVATSMAPL
jgi:hypothetical protein